MTLFSFKSISILVILSLLFACAKEGEGDPASVQNPDKTVSPDPNSQTDNPNTVGTTPTNDFKTISNNSVNIATLSGGKIGNGLIRSGEGYKTVEVLVTNPLEGYEVSATGFAGRRYLASDWSFITISITNTTEQSACFVKASNGIEYLDEQDNVIAVESLETSFVQGTSVLLKSSGIAVNACLMAGETGYISLIEADIYNALAKVRLDTIEKSNSEFIPQGGSFLVQSYHVIPNSLNIDYVLKNFGPESVVEKNIFRVFYNSDEGYPIHWDLVTPSKFKILSAEGEETVSAKTLYQGQVESITVVTGFKSSTGTASVFPDSAGSSIDPPADSEIMLKERLDQHTLHLITLENQ